jgi:hypothetical protein
LYRDLGEFILQTSQGRYVVCGGIAVHTGMTN